MEHTRDFAQKTGADWTPEHIANYWAYHALRPYRQPEYFSYQVGQGITNFLRATGRLHGKVLDYGCGPGHLLHYLLEEEQLACFGAEFSPEVVAHVNHRFRAHPRWKGALQVAELPTPYQENAFDVVTCIEVIEHLPDDLLSPVIAELRRLVKPGGMVLFSTPHAEDLEAGMAYCPFCNTAFHARQHLRTFTSATLRALLAAHGFEVLLCRATYLRYFQPPQQYSSFGRRLRSWLKHGVDQALDRVNPRPFPRGRAFTRQMGPGGPHLCAVVTPTI